MLEMKKKHQLLKVYISIKSIGAFYFSTLLYVFLVYNTTLLVKLMPGEQSTSERVANQKHIKAMKDTEMPPRGLFTSDGKRLQ